MFIGVLYEATNGAQSANVDANAMGISAIALLRGRKISGVSSSSHSLISTQRTNAKKYAAVFKPVEHSRQYCAVSQPKVEADVAAAKATKMNTTCDAFG